MNLYHRNGIEYRELDPDDVVKISDSVADFPVEDDKHWTPPQQSIGMTAKQAMKLWPNLRWLCPYDPLLYAMRKALGKNK